MQAVGGDTVRWGHVEHLLAGLIDAQQVGNYLTAKAHFKGGPKTPKPLPRPGDKPSGQLKVKPRRTYTVEEYEKVRDAWAQSSDVVETAREV